MRVRKHAHLFSILAAASVFVPVVIIFSVATGFTAQIPLELLCAAFVVPALAALLFLYRIPARCEIPECRGEVHPTWDKVALGEYILQYRCSECGQVYDGAFKMKFGGPNEWG